jgi:hypothetical protein
MRIRLRRIRSQGMPLTGNVPWDTPGHAANRHYPLGPAAAPVILGTAWPCTSTGSPVSASDTWTTHHASTA